MTLNPLHVATQGVGFRLTPIALAVQGLLELIAEDEARNYYGGGKSQSRDADTTQQVIDKYDAIERARKSQDDVKNRPAQKEEDPLEKLVAEAKRDQAIKDARQRNLIRAKADELAKKRAKVTIERAMRPDIAMPFEAASKALSNQRSEDDKIMALMAMMLLED